MGDGGEERKRRGELAGRVESGKKKKKVHSKKKKKERKTGEREERAKETQRRGRKQDIKGDRHTWTERDCH